MGAGYYSWQLKRLTNIRVLVSVQVDVFRQNLFQEVSHYKFKQFILEQYLNITSSQSNPQTHPRLGHYLLYQAFTQDKLLLISSFNLTPLKTYPTSATSSPVF